jgi:hypothetical protein
MRNERANGRVEQVVGVIVVVAHALCRAIRFALGALLAVVEPRVTAVLSTATVLLLLTAGIFSLAHTRGVHTSVILLGSVVCAIAAAGYPIFTRKLIAGP